MTSTAKKQKRPGPIVLDVAGSLLGLLADVSGGVLGPVLETHSFTFPWIHGACTRSMWAYTSSGMA